MQQITYTSLGRPDSFVRDCSNILALARRNNPELGITGLLVTHDTTYLQVLEGPGETLSALIDYLATDKRHSGFRVLRREVIRGRKFYDWAMAHRSVTTSDPAALGIIPALAAVQRAPNPTDSEIRALIEQMLEFDKALGSHL